MSLGCSLACHGPRGANTYSRHTAAIFAYVYSSHDTWMLIYVQTHVCLLFPLRAFSLHSPSHLPGFAPYTCWGAQGLCLSVTTSQAWRGTLAGTSCLCQPGMRRWHQRNTGWGWRSPGVAKSLQRASARAHQIAPDWVDGEQEEDFCFLCSHMTTWWTLLPLQYLNETSAFLTSSKPECL